MIRASKSDYFCIAVPTPSPLDYFPKPPESGVQYSILGKHNNMKDELANMGAGPAKFDIRPIKNTSDGTPQWSFGHRINNSKGFFIKQGF